MCFRMVGTYICSFAYSERGGYKSCIRGFRSQRCYNDFKYLSLLADIPIMCGNGAISSIYGRKRAKEFIYANYKVTQCRTATV